MKVYVVNVVTFVMSEPIFHVYGVYKSYQTAHDVEQNIREFFARIYGEAEDFEVWIEEAEVE